MLSFAAALGVGALAFRHVFGFQGEDTAFPLFVFAFLVALGIDYTIFLMTRIREESALSGTREGTLTALAATGGVITSAGLVLAGTFAALATLPVVGFAEIGFAVAFGVLLDTMAVRSVLVTALTLDMRHRVWWPSRPTVPAPPRSRPGSRRCRTPLAAVHEPRTAVTARAWRGRSPWHGMCHALGRLPWLAPFFFRARRLLPRLDMMPNSLVRDISTAVSL